MEKYFVVVVLLQLVYLTSSIYSRDLKDKNDFFRKDYEYFASTRSFYKFHAAHRNWLSAKKRCANEGAFLWYPEDQTEVEIVVEFWKEKRPSELIIYIGMSDLLDEGTFETIDGKLADEVWNHWGTGEPNNDPAYGGEDCAVIRRNDQAPGGLDLNDNNCKESMSFICKKTLASVEWNYLCDMPDQRYIFNGNLNKCYKVHQTPLNWNEAHSVCTAEQSYLAVINSAQERDFLVNFTKEAHSGNSTFRKQYPGNYVHLGFHNRFGEGWQTVTGIPLEQSGWNVWSQGQPDGQGKEQCGALSEDGLYLDLWCDGDEKDPFVCEHDIGLLRNSIDERLGNK